MKFDAPIGEPPAVQFIGVERLAIDRSYQRGTHSETSQRLIATIAAKWDWRLCTPLLVASRDGGLYIIDGQHRWEAAKLRGDIQYMPCAVGAYTGDARGGRGRSGGSIAITARVPRSAAGQSSSFAHPAAAHEIPARCRRSAAAPLLFPRRRRPHNEEG